MNLPATAIEFLDAFRGSLSPALFSANELLPRVHVYCFEKAGEPPATTLVRVAGYLGADPGEGATVRLVRDVSPRKRMLCVSFTLPAAVAFAAKGKGTAEAEAEEAEEALSTKKRQKTDKEL